MIEDSYGRKLDVIVSSTDLAAKLLSNISNKTDYQAEQVPVQTDYLAEIVRLIEQLDRNVVAEIAAVRKTVEDCCEKSKSSTIDKIDPSEADEGREEARMLTERTSDMMKSMQGTLSQGFSDLQGGLSNIHSVLIESQKSTNQSFSDPVSAVANAVGSPQNNSVVVTPIPPQTGIIDINNSIPEPPASTSGTEREKDDRILSDQLEAMSRGLTGVASKIGISSLLFEKALSGLGIDLMKVFDGVVIDSATFITNARMASFETRKWGEDTQEVAKKWLEVGSVVSETGYNRVKFKEIYQKEIQKGLNYEIRTIEHEGKLKRSLVQRDQKDQQRLVKTSIQTAFMIGSNAEETSAMFSEWQRHLALSNLELNQMSDSLKMIARTTGISGDNLLAAAKAAAGVTKEMRKTGALTVSGMANVTQMTALFHQYGVEEFGGKLTNALSSWENFNKSEPRMRAMIAAAAGATGTMDKVYAGTALNSRKDANKIFGGIEANLMSVLGDYGISELKELPALLEDLDLGVKDQGRYGDETSQSLLAGQLRNFLTNKGIGPGEIEGLIKAREANKSPAEKMAELSSKKASIIKKGGAGSEAMVANVDKAMKELGEAQRQESFNVFASQLGKTTTREEALTKANQRIVANEGQAVSMDQINQMTATMVQDMIDKGKQLGIEGDLSQTLTENSFKSVEELISAMNSGNNIISSGAAEVYRSLLQKVEVEDKVSKDPLMQVYKAINKSNEWLEEIAESWLFSMGGKAMAALIALSLGSKVASLGLGLLSGAADVSQIVSAGGTILGTTGAAGNAAGTASMASAAAGTATGVAPTVLGGGVLSKVLGSVVPGIKNAYDAVDAARTAGTTGRSALSSMASAGFKGTGKFARVFGGLGNKLPVIGTIFEVFNRIGNLKEIESNAVNTRDEKNAKHVGNFLGAAGGLAGAGAGAANFGAWGAALGTAILPGIGTAIGGGIGAIGGGLVGYFAGSRLGETIGEYIYQPFVDTLRGIGNFIYKTVSKIGSFIGSIFGGLVDWSSKALLAVTGLLFPVTLLKNGVGLLGSTVPDVGKRLQGLASTVSTFGQRLLGFFSGLIPSMQALTGLGDLFGSIFPQLQKQIESFIPEGVKGILGWFTGAGNNIDKNVEKQKAEGTFLNHQDPKNPMKEQWAALCTNEENVSKGIESLQSKTITGDSANFVGNAKSVLNEVLIQKERYGIGGIDQWTETIRVVEEGAKKLGVALDSETQTALDALKGKSEKDHMRTQVRTGLQNQGLIIGRNVSKEEFDAKTAEVLSEKLKASGMNPDGTKIVEKMAEKAVHPGSIYTHDIHCEKILALILAIMTGKAKTEEVDRTITELGVGVKEGEQGFGMALNDALVAPEKADVTHNMLGAFAGDQTKEAMIDALQSEMALVMIQAGVASDLAQVPLGENSSPETRFISALPAVSSSSVVGPNSSTERIITMQHDIANIISSMHLIDKYKNESVKDNNSSVFGSEFQSLNTMTSLIKNVMESNQKSNLVKLSDIGAFDHSSVKEAMLDASQVHQSEVETLSSSEQKSENKFFGNQFSPGVMDDLREVIRQKVTTGQVPFAVSGSAPYAMPFGREYRSVENTESYGTMVCRDRSSLVENTESYRSASDFIEKIISSNVFSLFGKAITENVGTLISRNENLVDRNSKEESKVNKTLFESNRSFEITSLDAGVEYSVFKYISDISNQKNDVFGQSLKTAQEKSYKEIQSSEVVPQSMGLFSREQGRDALFSADDVSSRTLMLTAGAIETPVSTTRSLENYKNDKNESNQYNDFVKRLSQIVEKTHSNEFSGNVFGEKDSEFAQHIFEMVEVAKKTLVYDNTFDKNTNGDYLKSVVDERSREVSYGSPVGLGAFALNQPRVAMMDADSVASMTLALQSMSSKEESQEKSNYDFLNDIRKYFSTSIKTEDAIRGNDYSFDKTSSSAFSSVFSSREREMEKAYIGMTQTGLFDLKQAREAMFEADSHSVRSIEALKEHTEENNKSNFDRSSLSEIIRSIMVNEQSNNHYGRTNMTETGLFDLQQAREAMFQADGVTTNRMGISSVISDSSIESERLKAAVEKKRFDEITSKSANMINSGLFNYDNVKETSRESISAMSNIYGRDLNLAYTAAQSGVGSQSKGNAGTSKALYLSEDDDYSTLNSYLANAAASASPAKGQVSSNLISMEDAESYVARQVHGEKPSGANILIPGIDALLDYVSSESAEREERIIKILEQIRDAKGQQDLLVGQGGPGKRPEGKSGIHNWSRDVIRGAWTDAMHGAYSTQSNHTGDVRGS